MTTADFLGHFGYVLIAASFLVRDILWLRMLSVVASVFGIGFGLLSEVILWPTVIWSALFAAINSIQIGILVRENRAVRFTDEERELYETIFRNVSPVEFLKLMRIGTWRDLPVGGRLAVEGELLPDLMLVFTGQATVEAQGKAVATLRTGDFIGEMSFITALPATATVTTTTPSRIVSWPKDALRKLTNRNPSLGFGLQTIFNTDLTRKLTKSNEVMKPLSKPLN